MRILCLGETLVDLVCEHPVDSAAEADAFVPRFGGDMANAAVNAARRGADIALASGAGDDAWGVWLRERLTAERVGLEWFGLLSGVRTPIAFVTVDSTGDPSFLFYGEAIAPAVRAVGRRLPEAVGACDAFFFTSNTLLGDEERVLALSGRSQALDEGKPVVMDANLRPGRWASAEMAVSTVKSCITGTALLKCNRAESKLLSGRDDPAAAAAALLELGAQAVVVTLGADGALLRGAGGERNVPGVPATPIDATGAGDAVTGTLLARLGAADFDLKVLPDALDEAVDAGARATEHWGAIA